MGESVLRSIQELRSGQTPQYAVNRDAAEHPTMRARLEQYRDRTEQS
jgi:hypothetical protein